MKLQYLVVTLVILCIMSIPHVFADSSDAWKITIKRNQGVNNTSFWPQEIHVRQNETIQWTNNDTTAHTVTSGVLDHPTYVGKIFDSGIISPGSSFSLKITDKTWSGYYYFCKIHPWMTGKIDAGIAYLGISPDFSIETDKNSYYRDDVIRISGIVNNTNQIMPLTIQIFDNERNLVYLDKTNLLSDHSFFYKLKASKNLFKTSGSYKIKSMYGFPSTITDVNIHLDETQPQNLTANIQHVPKWIKNNAKLWNDNKISDDEFINGIQFLIKKGYIIISVSKTSETNEVIPVWIKNNISSWANGESSDDEFTSSVTYLVDHKIIKI